MDTIDLTVSSPKQSSELCSGSVRAFRVTSQDSSFLLSTRSVYAILAFVDILCDFFITIAAA